MQGLNARFMANVPVFLNATSMCIRSRHDFPTPFGHLQAQQVPPEFDFDLEVFAPGVRLIPFAAHPKTHALGKQRPIHAYWLDYEADEDKICDLNGNATYLFTPSLNGCYIGVANGRICHGAGEDEWGHGRGNTAAMRQFAAAALGTAPVIGLDSQHIDAEDATLVGVRAGGIWSWYVQGHARFLAGSGALQPIFDANNNNVPALYRGHTVIQLTDMTLG
jgi:hypothetical protein